MNIINAIYNLVNNPITELVSHYSGSNRANNAGDALEEYIKDLFANSFNLDENERLERWSNVFSYLGNNSNPPDAMLRHGDAIEIKKLEGYRAALALNSSYPTHMLRADSDMITAACRDAEDWTEKDIIYAVGLVSRGRLRHLCMVYGADYCASNSCYADLKQKIKTGIEKIDGMDFADTKELGRINDLDPMGITYLRVRPMWGIENPLKVFSDVYKRKQDRSFELMCIINLEKWKSFDNTELLEEIIDENFHISDIMIKNPDSPSELREAKLITYSME